MSINPSEIKGSWDKGYVLDKHIIKSIPIGENAYGYMQFNTTYTEIGELVNGFKYHGRYDNLDKIVALVKTFLDGWDMFNRVNMILPVPPTKIRIYQPVIEIASAIAKHYQKGFSDKVLEKITQTQSKVMNKSNKDLTGSIIANQKAKNSLKILLIDDLFDTGATLNECVHVLRQDPKLQEIYVLAITKTK